jgi:phosphoglycerate dehydrogenase-like enzyme
VATTVLVLAAPDDEALTVLDPPPAGVHLVVGWEPATLTGAAAEAEAMIVGSAGRDRVAPVFRAAPRLRWLHSLAAGLDTLLFPELVDSPVVLTNARGAYSASLAEWVMGAVLFFAKDLRRLVRRQEMGVWEPFDGRMIEGTTLGIVGYGDIGRAVAERARGFRMKVQAVRRSPSPDALCERVVGPEARDEVLAASDYVVVTLPLTPETRGLIDAAAFAAMKPDAVFMNIGRGPVVQETALIEALRAGRLRGAALDVFEREPLPPGHPFYTMENVLLSPHTADHVAGWRQDSMRLFLENLARFREGRPLLNVIDKRRGY